jgi:protein-L-isoaspartate(D-aspartate) O-methyltransferase
LEDTYILKGLRKRLVNELKEKGIKDERILNAFMDIPRHWFIDSMFAELAYRDQPFDIGEDQTISQPYTVAFMTELLEIKKGDKVLEIGTGSGYQACVLAYLGAKVYSIERQEFLFHKTNKLLQNINYQHIRTILGDGYEGAQRFAPFDKIIITAGAPYIPEKLTKQLQIGGMMIVPVDSNGNQEMIRITRTSESEFKSENFGKFIFVPMLKGVRNKS